MISAPEDPSKIPSCPSYEEYVYACGFPMSYVGLHPLVSSFDKFLSSVAMLSDAYQEIQL